MTTKLEQEIAELKELITVQKPKKNGSWTKYIGTAITILVLGSGLVGSWTTLRAQSEVHQQEIVKLQDKTDAAEQRIRELELKNAGDTQRLIAIQKAIDEINKKLDDLRP